MWRPDRAERQDFAGQRPVDHTWKARGRGRLAGQGETPVYGNQVHQIIPADTLTLDARMMAQLGEMLDQIVVNLGSGVGLTDDEVPLPKIGPGNFIL